MFRNSGFILLISLTFLIFMMTLLGWMVLNSHHLVRNIRENMGFQIFLKDSVPGTRLEELQTYLDRSPCVRQWVMIGKEEAARNMKEKLGEDFIGFLGYNPLLNMLDVRVKAEYAVSDSIEPVIRNIRMMDAVHEVVYMKDVVDKINRNMRTLFYFIGIFAGSLLLVAVFLMNNTLRLNIYSQRFIIRTMYLVGAARLFVAKPFLIRSVLYGLLAGSCGLVLFSLLFYLFSSRFPELATLVQLKEILMLMAAVLLFSVVISFLGTLLAVWRYINLKSSELYN